MNPQPKNKRIKLSPKDHHEMRHKIYNNQLGCCKQCTLWVDIEQFHLHHKTSKGAGGDDEYDVNDPENSNLVGLCWQCHRKVHDGNVRLSIY